MWLFNVPGGSVDMPDGDRLDLDGGGTSTGAAFNIGSKGFARAGNPYVSTRPRPSVARVTLKKMRSSKSGVSG